MNHGSAKDGDDLMKKTHDLAKKRFDDICTPALRNLAKYVPGRIPYVCVSSASASISRVDDDDDDAYSCAVFFSSQIR